MTSLRIPSRGIARTGQAVRFENRTMRRLVSLPVVLAPAALGPVFTERAMDCERC